MIGVTGKELNVTSFLIARAISKRGTKAQKVFSRVEKQEKNNIIRIVEKAIKKLERAYSD